MGIKYVLILEQDGQMTNERECYRPKTVEEKKKYKACDGAQSTKDDSCLKMTGTILFIIF